MNEGARSKRFKRNPEAGPLELTPRDVAVLHHVARHRFLSSQQIAKLDGGSEQNVLRSLRLLFDHAYLDRPAAQLAQMPISGPKHIVYGLGRRGARALRERHQRIAEVDWTEKNKRSGAIFIAHTLAVADFMVGIEIACAKRGDIRLITEEEILSAAPEQTRHAREPLRLVVPGISNRIGVSSVIPDGIFGLAFPDDTAAYFLLEIDRGSMPVRRSTFERTSFHRKLAIYWEIWKRRVHEEHLGLRQIRVLTVTESKQRVERMLDVVNELTAEKGTGFFLFASTDEMGQDVLSCQWVDGRGGKTKLID